MWGSLGLSSSMVPVEVVKTVATVVAGVGEGVVGWRVRCVILEGQEKSSAGCGVSILE